MKMHYMQHACYKKETHKTPYFKKIWNQLILPKDPLIVDPFARNCPLAGHFTNDLNPATKAVHHYDAVVFLQGLPSNHFDLAILDPPFSERMALDKYGLKVNIYTDATYFKKVMMELHRILKPGGQILRFGYCSSTMCKGLETEEVWVCNWYSGRNDVIVARMRKMNHTII